MSSTCDVFRASAAASSPSVCFRCASTRPARARRLELLLHFSAVRDLRVGRGGALELRLLRLARSTSSIDFAASADSSSALGGAPCAFDLRVYERLYPLLRAYQERPFAACLPGGETVPKAGCVPFSAASKVMWFACFRRALWRWIGPGCSRCMRGSGSLCSNFGGMTNHRTKEARADRGWPHLLSMRQSLSGLTRRPARPWPLLAPSPIFWKRLLYVSFAESLMFYSPLMLSVRRAAR